MPFVTVICERCLKETNGYTNEFGTSGFYRIDQPAWQKYQRNTEKIICDSCMHNDSKYKKDFIWAN